MERSYCLLLLSCLLAACGGESSTETTNPPNMIEESDNDNHSDDSDLDISTPSDTGDNSNIPFDADAISLSSLTIFDSSVSQSLSGNTVENIIASVIQSVSLVFDVNDVRSHITLGQELDLVRPEFGESPLFLARLSCLTGSGSFSNPDLDESTNYWGLYDDDSIGATAHLNTSIFTFDQCELYGHTYDGIAYFDFESGGSFITDFAGMEDNAWFIGSDEGSRWRSIWDNYGVYQDGDIVSGMHGYAFWDNTGPTLQVTFDTLSLTSNKIANTVDIESGGLIYRLMSEEGYSADGVNISLNGVAVTSDSMQFDSVSGKVTGSMVLGQNDWEVRVESDGNIISYEVLDTSLNQIVLSNSMAVPPF